MKIFDLIIIGGGQSALACAYYLRRTSIKYLILDDQQHSGGAWQHVWDSLTLFSPAEQSSLPGWMMPKSENDFPEKQEVLQYLMSYKNRYGIEIQYNVKILKVEKHEGIFTLSSDKDIFRCKTVVSATGSFQKPFIPKVTGRTLYKGQQLHSSEYRNPNLFGGKRVLIVGAGNSGAQILSEISKVAETAWTSKNPPEFFPDDVDGRVLFDVASARYYAMKKGKDFDAGPYSVGSIVMVPSVQEARERGILVPRESLKALSEDGVIWADESREHFDVIIWCTGFNFATDHLKGLGILNENGSIDCDGTKSKEIKGLWLVGYGSFTGFASATLIGVGRSARQTVDELIEYLKLT